MLVGKVGDLSRYPTGVHVSIGSRPKVRTKSSHQYAHHSQTVRVPGKRITIITNIQNIPPTTRVKPVNINNTNGHSSLHPGDHGKLCRCNPNSFNIPKSKTWFRRTHVTTPKQPLFKLVGLIHVLTSYYKQILITDF